MMEDVEIVNRLLGTSCAFLGLPRERTQQLAGRGGPAAFHPGREEPGDRVATVPSAHSPRVPVSGRSHYDRTQAAN